MKNHCFVFAVGLAALAVDASSGEISGSQPAQRVADPVSLTFRKMASRRYVLDNELPLASYEPNCVIADVQHPSPTFDENLILVAGWCPCAHYAVDVSMWRKTDLANTWVMRR